MTKQKQQMAHFRIRYATYNGRFKACTMLDTIEYVNDSATAFPQNTGRLEKLLSHDTPPQNEDSFFLDIWTPQSGDKKPVLFWIHGGAFVAGASSDKQNDATHLANNANIIVVSVSYRLGFLGTAYFDGISQQNCGFHDIITALEWTNKHISQFNGDANNITIGGQSSGAWYAMAIHTSQKLQHLFQKTMLFSWPGTMKAISKQTSQSISNSFLAHINSIEDEPIETILEMQKAIGKENKKKYNFDVPLLPSSENEYISNNVFRDIEKIDKRLFIQYTENECGAYVYHYPIGPKTPPLIVAPFLKRYCPEQAYKNLKKDRRNTKDTYKSVVNITSEILFREPAKQIAHITGKRCILHEFSYPAGNQRTGCCHCFDIPFILGCIENWQTSKIFEGCDFEKMKQVSLQLQNTIRLFLYDEDKLG